MKVEDKRAGGGWAWMTRVEVSTIMWGGGSEEAPKRK